MPSKSREQLVCLLNMNQVPSDVQDKILNMSNFNEPFIVKIFKGYEYETLSNLGLNRYYDCLNASNNYYNPSIWEGELDPSVGRGDGTPHLYSNDEDIAITMNENVAYEDNWYKNQYVNNYELEKCENCNSPKEKCKRGFAGCMCYKKKERCYPHKKLPQHFVGEHDCEDTRISFHRDYLQIHRRVWRVDCFDEFLVLYRGWRNIKPPKEVTVDRSFLG